MRQYFFLCCTKQHGEEIPCLRKTSFFVLTGFFAHRTPRRFFWEFVQDEDLPAPYSFIF